MRMRVPTGIALAMSLAVLCGWCPAAGATASGKATVTVSNRSDWEIHHFYLSPADENHWGPDQLGDDVIGTGESFTLKDIPCDTYDVKLVDEDGDECVIGSVDLCAQKDHWVITSDDLLDCEEESGS